MNIFWLDEDPVKCARYHCDKHVVKMPTEYAQLLSSAMSSWGLDAPYNDTHVNHPCAIWVRESVGNYQRLWDLAMAVGEEYTYRYGKIHKAHQLLLDGTIPRTPKVEVPELLTPFPNCTAYATYPPMTGIDLYRIFYMTHKSHIAKYKNREVPYWMGDRFYQQQYGVTLGCKAPTRGSFTLKPQYAGKELPVAKPTKDDIVSDLGIPELKKMLLKDLQVLAALDKMQFSGDVPEGRLKAPYVDALNTVCSLVTWNKLTVADMKAVLAAMRA